MLFGKVNKSLHPYISLEPSSHLRLAVQILRIDTDVELQIIAAYSHLVDFLSGHSIGHFMTFYDFPQDGVLVTFHAVGHEIGVHETEYILFLDSLGNGGISVHIL